MPELEDIDLHLEAIGELSERDQVSRMLDDLLQLTHQYKSSRAYHDMLRFVGRFRFYSTFNAMLVYTQMPGARYVATASRWLRDYGRKIRLGARPLVILRPKGPVMFVFDVSDTEPWRYAHPLPPEIESPFEVRGGQIRKELERTIENARRDGVEVAIQSAGSQSAGQISTAQPGRYLTFPSHPIGRRQTSRVPRRYELLLNSAHSREARYATLVHELAHLYCGHLGTPNEKWWPDRRGLDHKIRELEAESVCYIVCARNGLSSPSEEYLAGYVSENESTPNISLDAIMRAVGLIEAMGTRLMPPRASARKRKTGNNS